MGLLHGRGGSKSVVTCEVVGFLCASIGRVVARYLAHRHLERPMPRKRRNAGGGICCTSWMRAVGRIHLLSGPAKPDETYCSTVTDAYLFAAHWSQEPQ